MNATFVQSQQHPFFNVQDDEKNRIMEKVYNSDVFKEFIRQWGDAMSSRDQRSEKH